MSEETIGQFEQLNEINDHLGKISDKLSHGVKILIAHEGENHNAVRHELVAMRAEIEKAVSNDGVINAQYEEILSKLIRISNENRDKAFDAKELKELTYQVGQVYAIAQDTRGQDVSEKLRRLYHIIDENGEAANKRHPELISIMVDYYEVQVNRLSSIESWLVAVKEQLVRQSAGQLALTAFSIVNTALLVYVIIKGIV